MSKPATVTREHRQRAVEALGIAQELHARYWVTTAAPAESNADMRDVAQALADAEQRTRQEDAARIREWTAQVPAELSSYADDLRLLADDIERGEHVRRNG